MAKCGPWSDLLAVVVSLSCVVVLNGHQDGEVAIKWGVADGTATVGRLFRMHIPSDAFSGNVRSYTVKTFGGSPLPSWLEFDVKNNVLQGIPTPKDAGQLYLAITAQGPSGQATATSTIFIRDVPSHTSGVPLQFKPSGPEFVRCKEKEPETVATIIVDVNMETMPVSDRLTLLNKFLSHMELHEEMIKMVPVGDSPMHDTSALVSGTGDSLTPKTSGLFISWPVGCGKVKEGHFPILQKLDDDSGSGRMAKVLGHSVIGWRVTNSHFQAPTRKRRQVHSTPTPAVTPIMPTKTDSKQAKTDERDDKMTHQVVVTQSPTFIHPTATQPHMAKTDEPIVPPVMGGLKEDKLGHVMPTETMTKVIPVARTKDMPVIRPTATYDPSEPTDVPVIGDCLPGQNPEVKHPIQKLTYNPGDIIDYHIPGDTFEDCEVGDTQGLELVLFLNTTAKIEPDYFLQFDSDKQKIFGLPMNENVGTHNFNLIAKKKSGLLANSAFTVQIRKLKQKKKSHELSVTIDLDYKKFMQNVTERVLLANKVASVYGDSDTKMLTVTKIQPGSVIYGWANSSLPTMTCPAEKITELTRKLVNKDGTLNENAVHKLKPFVLLGADVTPAGACEDDPNFPVVIKPKAMTTPAVDMDEEDDKDLSSKNVIDKPDDDKEPQQPTKKPETTTVESVAKGSKDGDGEDDIWITTVIPAVVIVVILLIALLIACILYRKKRKGKMNVEEQNTFINKGAPVIFPDELEDKPSDVNKPLLLEGSPAPPPEYHRGPSESPERHHNNSNNRNNTINLNRSTDDSITEMPAKPYEPPPPVTASTNNKQPRTTHSQQPYSQPPQILP